MKLKILNGRSRFRQWDLNQKLVCEGVEAGTQVHFASPDSETALVVKSYELDGKTVADVPNILLQAAIPLYAYVYIQESDEKYTKHRAIFGVDERPKPEDYIYTETEVLSYSELDKRITSLENNLREEVKEAIQKVIDDGDFDIEGGTGIESIEQTTASTEDEGENVLTITLTDGTKMTFKVRNGSKGGMGEQGPPGPQGEQGIQGEKGADGADGHTPQKGIDYFTEADKTEFVQLVLNALPDGDEVSY